MSQSGAKTINFAGRAANSPQFDALYAEGMKLVETTATYLDGPGRAVAKTLPANAASLYSAESIRLTTRLMQLASWLLLQRSLNTGEMTREQVLQERHKLRFSEGGLNRSVAGWSDLPVGFQELLEASQRLEARIRILDDNLMQEESGEPSTCESANENQVIAQIDLLQTAFSRR